MTFMFDGFNDIIRLQKGERLSEAIEQFARESRLQGAWVVGLGGVLEVTLGFYDLEAKAYHWQTFEGVHEMTNLTGNLALDDDGKLMFHLHGTFSGPDFKTIGGHVKDLVAGGTIELFVHRTYKPLLRKPDTETGLSLLDI